MKPGATNPCPASMRTVFPPTSAATSALSPTARMVSPREATAAAQGRVESPVQTRPNTTKSALGAVEQPASRAAARRARDRMGVRRGSGAEPGQAAQRLELLDGAGSLGRRGGRHGEEVPDVEEDLQHELVAHVRVVEIGHAIDRKSTRLNSSH